MSTTIKISDAVLKAAAEQGIDEFIKVFAQKYYEVLDGQLNPEKMSLLNGHQHTLLAYYCFREEVMGGGFIQLIQNGYGPYVFENPFAKAMRMFGAKDFSKLIYKAKEVYDKHKEDLTRECSDEDFMAMYEQYEVFDDMEEEFLEMEEQVTTLLASYVDQHLEEFAVIE